MSFDVSSTGYKGFSETKPSDPVTGNVEQPKQGDKTAGSKLASVVKGISAHCDGVNVQLAPPNLGSPTVDNSGKTEEKDGGEKAENKSSGGTTMTVNGTDDGGETEVEETKAADGEKKADASSTGSGKTNTDESKEAKTKPMQIAGPTSDEQMEAKIKDDIKQKVSADIWEKAQTDPASALIDAEDAGYTELAKRIEGLMYSQSLA